MGFVHHHIAYILLGILRFPAPRFERDHRSAVINEVERQATEAWGSKARAIAAYDYMTVRIPPMMSNDDSAHVSSEYSDGTQALTMQLYHADPVEGFLYPARDRNQGSGDWSRNGNGDRKRRR